MDQLEATLRPAPHTGYALCAGTNTGPGYRQKPNLLFDSASLQPPAAETPVEKADLLPSDAVSMRSHATFSSVAVMLRLRLRYVSKAAISKLPIQHVSAEIEVHLEFQGLGSLGADVATVFSLRI